MRMIGFLILFLLIGLAVGYGVFGKVNNEYVNPVTFFTKPSNLIDKISTGIMGFEKRGKNILISGAIGGAVGLLFGALKGKKK
jgi:hypothetical protein